MGGDAHLPSSATPRARPARCPGHGPRRRTHQGPHQAAAPRRHRRDRPPGHRPGERRGAARLPARRPSSTPRRPSPAATPTSAPRSWSRPASRCSTTSARRSCSRCGRGSRSASRATRCTWATSSSPAAGATTPTAVRAAMSEARAGLAVQLEAFAANTMEYLRRERELLLDGVGVPDITHHARGPARPGRGARLPLQGGPADAAPLHPGVPAGPDRRGRRRGRPDRGRPPARPHRRRHGLGLRRVADLRRRGRRARLPRRPRPRARAGRRSSASTPSSSRPPAPARTSRCCSPTTRAPTSSWPSAPTPPSWSSSTRGASGMASTFLTRLRVGGKLVDAKGVSRLYRAASPDLSLAVMLIVGLFALFVALAATPGGTAMLALVGARWDDVWSLARRNLHVIDFRYHLVSIVSIFLALAVGIVLGAGPLKEDLGNTLTRELTQLRQDKTGLRADLTAAQRGIGARDTWAEQVSPRVVAGTLTGKTVAVVVAPGADGGVVKDTVATLAAAGAKVGSTHHPLRGVGRPRQADVPQQPRGPAGHAGQGARRRQQPRPAARRGALAGDPRRQRRRDGPAHPGGQPGPGRAADGRPGRRQPRADHAVLVRGAGRRPGQGCDGGGHREPGHRLRPAGPVHGLRRLRGRGRDADQRRRPDHLGPARRRGASGPRRQQDACPPSTTPTCRWA